MEKLPNNIDTAKTKAPDQENVDMSRRNFLRGAVALAGSTFLEACSIVPFAGVEVGEAKKNESETEKNKERTSEIYEAGIKELHRKAMYDDNEDSAVFVVKKDGSAEWLTISDEEKERYKTSTSVPVSYLHENVAQKDVVYIELAHTHPVAAFSLSDQNKDYVRKGWLPPPTMPPSLTDIGSDLMISRGIDIKDQFKFRKSVVDPAGVWTYSIDQTNPAIKKMEEVQIFSTEMLKKLGDSMEIKKLIKDGKISYHSGDHPISQGLTFVAEITKHLSELKPEQAALVTSVIERSASLGQSSEIAEFMTSIEYSNFSRELTDAENLAKAVGIYKRMGVELKFSPFGKEKIGVEK